MKMNLNNRLKGFFSLLFSTRLMALLFLVFAFAMGLGTFIEHWYNTDTARKLIYNAWWFEGILLLFILNFFGNIKRYNLLKKRKWPALLLHLSFIVIISGAFWTRYIGYEGTMSIREGETSNYILSDEAYLTVLAERKSKEKIHRTVIEKELLLSPLVSNVQTFDGHVHGTPFNVAIRQYIMNAEKVIREDIDGDRYLKLMVSDGKNAAYYFLKEGSVQLINNKLFSFNKTIKGGINLVNEGSSYTVKLPVDAVATRMSDELQEEIPATEIRRLRFNWLYEAGELQFVVVQRATRGEIVYESKEGINDQKSDDVLIVDVTSKNGGTKSLAVSGVKGRVGQPKIVALGDLIFTISFGSKRQKLPFGIQLLDFNAEKYPGTEKSYSSFESHVRVLDGGKSLDHLIYMNNVLDYQGYRFFQASFHPDEKGTILAVNHDFWGTWISYIGYFLLYLGLVAILFDKNSRFGIVWRKLQKLSAISSMAILVFVLLPSVDIVAQNFSDELNLSKVNLDTVVASVIPDKEHSKNFGELVIQDGGGRMKPVNTFSSELLRKVHNNDTYSSYSADQVFLSMILAPDLWYRVPLISLEREESEVHRILDISPISEYAALSDFFDEDGWYRLTPYLGEAYRAFIPNKRQEHLIEIDRKANLLHFALSGRMLRIFPVPQDENNTWVSAAEINEVEFSKTDSVFTSNILPLYLSVLSSAIATSDYSKANTLLNKISVYQQKYGKDVMPSETRISAEILYNKYNILESLFPWYLILGLLLTIIGVAQTLIYREWMVYVARSLKFVLVLLFILHSSALVIRWYISGHAPWSDAYESIVYVSWATLLFGLYLGKRSYLTLGATSFIASIILMVAHWNWMDPAIANLQPVLNSYWLMVHVAIIVASYGPFTIGMILGLVSLILMAVTTKHNNHRLKYGIIELNYIIELSLTLGLVLLTIGNFLGGQWANESWGRYWGWDPKETWALISIIIYAFVIHMRLVPVLKGRWLFSLASVVAYYSIMMTYFGVNFYLSGLHSYASGDKVVTPTFIYYSVAALVLLATIAFYKKRKYLEPGIGHKGV